MKILMSAFLLLVLTGCPLDGIFGVHVKPDGTVETDGKGGGVGVVGETLGGIPGPVGLAGMAVSLLANLYQSIRGRKYVAALVSTVEAVESFTHTPEGEAVGKALKTTLSNKHGHDNVGPIMKKVVEATT